MVVMETRTQIIVAVFTALAGILLAVFVVMLAVCYRRRNSLQRTSSVHHRKYNRNNQVNTEVGISFGHMKSRNSRNFSSVNIERTFKKKIEQRPTLNQIKRKEQFRKMDKLQSSLRRQHSFDSKHKHRTINIETHQIPSLHLWPEKSRLQESETYSMGRQLPHIVKIPRPTVRSCKSELFENNRNSVYKYISDFQSGNISVRNNSSCGAYQ